MLEIVEKLWQVKLSEQLKRNKASIFLIGIIFILAILPRSLALNVFVGPDETSWIERSAKFATALAEGDLAETYQTGHPGVTLLWLESIGTWLRYAIHGDWASALGVEDSISVLAQKRLVLGLSNALWVAIIVCLTAQLFGLRVAALAGILLAFDPFLLSESRALRTEGLVTHFNTLALLSYLFYWQKPNQLRLGLAGVFTALALLSKVSALALLPLGALIIASAIVLSATNKGETILPLLKAWLGWGATIGLSIFVLWPALWVTPAHVAQEMYAYVALRAVEAGGGGHSFWFGQPTPSEDLSQWFYPVVILFRSNPLLWVGWLALPLVFRKQSDATWPKLWLAALGAYLLLYWGLIAASDLKYDRYIIPMFPTLMIISALGWVALTGWLAQRWPHLQSSLPWLGGGLILSLSAFFAASVHPYYYPFWNPLLGGIQQAVQVLPVATGNEGIDQAAAYLSNLPNAENITVSTANSQRLRVLFPGKTLSMTDLEGDWYLGDYTFVYLSQVQRGKHDPEILDYLARQDPIFSFDVNGLPYGWIYEGPGAQFWGGDTKLEGRGTLHAYSLSQTTLQAGDTLRLDIYFRNEGQQATDRFYVRLVDTAGYVWVESTVGPKPGFEKAFSVRRSVVEGEAQLDLPAGMLPGTYVLKMGYDIPSEGTLIGRFNLPSNSDTVQVKLAQQFSALVAGDGLLQIEDDIILHDYQLATGPEPASLWLTLDWQALRAVERDYVWVLRLLNQADEEIAYTLGRPARSMLPTNTWQANQPVRDPWLISPPADLPAATYQLELAVFDADTQAEMLVHPLGEAVYTETTWHK